MTSSIAWLDTSADEQRQVRELLSLFTQTESRDELGIGQVRDAFSDLLFPGTSVLQTRARYFLVVPWLFQVGATRRSGSELAAWVEQRERRLIEVLRREGFTDGLIGRIAGPTVKVLPSTIYWTGLVRHGILHRDVAKDRLGRPPAQIVDLDELVDRPRSDWHSTLPPAPAGFPDSLPGGFDLTPDEASWLAERMRVAAPDSLLAHLLSTAAPVDVHSPTPWDDAATAGAPVQAAEILEHAELFSLAVLGAALLYNLLVGEAYEAHGFTRVEAPVDDHRERLTAWAADCRGSHDRLRAWDRDRLWAVVLSQNPRIGLATRAFVDKWLDAVVDGQAAHSADDATLRSLIRTRELQQKRGQARLGTGKLLATWSGEAGTGRLDYRWGTVRRLVADIQGGLGRAGA